MDVLELQFKLEVYRICWSQSLPKVVGCFGQVYWLWKTGARIVCQLLDWYLDWLTIADAGLNKFVTASFFVFTVIRAAKPAPTCP